MNAYKYIYEDLKQTITNGEEWKDMPGEYDDRGYAELGNPEEMTIVRLMSLDLYLYYSDVFFQVLTDIAEELESVA